MQSSSRKVQSVSLVICLPWKALFTFTVAPWPQYNVTNGFPFVAKHCDVTLSFVSTSLINSVEEIISNYTKLYIKTLGSESFTRWLGHEGNVLAFPLPLNAKSSKNLTIAVKVQVPTPTITVQTIQTALIERQNIIHRPTTFPKCCDKNTKATTKVTLDELPISACDDIILIIKKHSVIHSHEEANYSRVMTSRTFHKIVNAKTFVTIVCILKSSHLLYSFLC